MPAFREWLARLCGALRRAPADADLERELRSHLGLAGNDSREARIRAGGVAQAMEALRDQRGLPWLENLLRDIRFGCRSLVRRPAFSIVTVLALSLGLCGTMTVFSIVNSWLLRPLEARDPGDLVRVTGPGGDSSASLSIDNEAHIRFADYLAYRDQNQSFASLIAGQFGGPVRVRIDGPPVMIVATHITGNYLSTLGIAAAMGRTFTPEDARPGAQPVIVLSDAGWKRFFDARPDVLGKTVRMDGVSTTIVGVLPESFTGTNAPMVPQIYRVITETRGVDVFPFRVQLIGRLKPGMSIDQARADLSRVAAQLTARDREVRPIEIYPARASLPLMLKAMSLLALLFGVIVVVVLLVVCDDVAILMTIRAAMRRKEIGVRLALGTTRARIVTELAVETGILCVASGLLGTYFAYVALQFAGRFYAPVTMPFALTVRMDWHVVAFAILASCIATVLCGIVPARQSLKTDVLTSLKGTSLSSLASFSGGVSSSLVIVQVALSTVLLVLAVVLAKSLLSTASPNRGFVSRGVIMSTIAMEEREYSPQRRLAFMESVLRGLGRTPGVTAAAVVDSVPLARNAVLQRIEVRDGAESHFVYVNRVSGGFFDTLQIGLAAGRTFAPADDLNAARVGIANETLARQFWPGQSAVGRRLQGADGVDIEVIGVVRDSKYESESELSRPLLYRPMASAPVASPTFLLKISGDPASMFALIRARVNEIDPDLVPYNLITLDERLNLGLAVNRAAATVAGTMGVLAFALGSLGIYGTIALLAQQRRQEFGIRLALGATPAQVMALIMRQGMRWAMYGLFIGLGGAWLAALGLTRFLAGVSSSDVWGFVITPLVLVITISVACYLPARRTLSLDPIETLRSE